MVNGFNVRAFIHFNHVAHTGRDVYNDVWIDCRYDSKFAARCGADGEGDEEAMMFEASNNIKVSMWGWGHGGG